MVTRFYEQEISYDLPQDIPHRYLNGGKPLFIAFGCILIEFNKGRSWIYKVVNLDTGVVEILASRKCRLDERDYIPLLQKIDESPARGRGKWEIDMRFSESLPVIWLRELLKIVFHEILPSYGYAQREAQIELAIGMFNTISARRILLAEAGVGIGKTHAYIIAAILAKRGRINDLANVGCYGDMTYVKAAHMPIVISTSSIALQQAIAKDYIPFISRILMENGLIRKPLSVVVRKGKQNYICERRLRLHLPFEHGLHQRQELERLTSPVAPYDLSNTTRITRYVKSKINVPYKCHTHCIHKKSCRYQRYFIRAQLPEIDIQVCNHNYLLADTRRRENGQTPLIPDYQCLIVDEAHKFLPAARQMFGIEFPSLAIPRVADDIAMLPLRNARTKKEVQKAAKKLLNQNNRLFRKLFKELSLDSEEDDSDRLPAYVGVEQARNLRNIRNISIHLSELLTAYNSMGEASSITAAYERILLNLKGITQQASVLAKHKDLIFWLEIPENISISDTIESGVVPLALLHAIPKELHTGLHSSLWNRKIPIILTSGTLSAGGDFTHIKRTLGIDATGRILETSKPSPFNYRENSLLYISEDVPFPDKTNPDYIMALADEIEQLIIAAHGHTAVLFTSHDVMGRVAAILNKRGLPFPLFRLGRGEVSAIDDFKQSGNGVLFASGSMWEGVDIPGDVLSLLIIVKLPFTVPDPVSDYEKTLYCNMDEYKARVITPQMLIKLKQGVGRLIRTMTDTGVVAILDIRAGEKGAFREAVLSALPPMRVTRRISDVGNFMRDKKPPRYFSNT